MKVRDRFLNILLFLPRHKFLVLVIAVAAVLFLPQMWDWCCEHFSRFQTWGKSVLAFLATVSYSSLAVKLVNWLSMPFALWELWRALFDQGEHPLVARPDFQLPEDRPWRKGDVDELGRRPYLRSLMMLIRHAPQNEGAQYVGVYGGWGDGKTSLRNQLQSVFEEECPDREVPIFIDVNVWRSVDSDDVAYEFFKCLADGVRERGLHRVRSGFISIADRLRVRVLSRYLGSDSMLLAVGRFLLDIHGNMFTIREKMRVALRACGRRLVVVIDDLDRMPPDDVCRIVRLIKSHGDLPNVTYLILADDKYLAAAIGTKMPEMPGRTPQEVGQEYLEKIVTIDCPLPSITDIAVLKQYLIKRLDKVHGRYCITGSKVLQDRLECVFPYFDDLRSIKRLLIAYEKELAFQQSKSRDGLPLSIDPSDLLALTAVRIKRPDVYRWLPGLYEILLAGAKTRTFFEKTGRQSELEALLQIDEAEGSDLVAAFLKTRLGVSMSCSGMEKGEEWGLDGAKSAKSYRQYRISSAYCFKNYFMSTEPATMVPRSLWEALMKPVTQGDLPSDDVIAGLVSRPACVLTLPYMLNDFPDSEDEKVNVAFVALLAALMNRPLPPTVQIPNLVRTRQSVCLRLANCLSSYCMKVYMNADAIVAMKVFLGGVTKTGGLSAMARMYCESPIWMSQAGKKQVADLLRQSFEAPNSAFTLQGMPDSNHVLTAWGEMIRRGHAQDVRCREALLPTLSEPALAVLPLEVFSKIKLMPEGEELPSLDFGLMDKTFSKSELCLLAETLNKCGHIGPDSLDFILRSDFLTAMRQKKHWH